MGMIKERIRTEEQNQRHRALVEENRRQKFKKYRQQQQENQLVCLVSIPTKRKHLYLYRKYLKDVVVKQFVQHHHHRHVYYQTIISMILMYSLIYLLKLTINLFLKIFFSNLIII
jgi:hypothetical protein